MTSVDWERSLSIESDTPAYLKTWADEIGSRANRVRNLIGDRHWLSDGTYKEFLIRELLIRHIPNFLTATRGFIRPIHRSDSCSPEIDLLIADPCRHVPLFNEGGLQIVAPSSVLGTIEVKSTYSYSVLKKAIDSVVRTRLTLVNDREMHQVWSTVLLADPGDAFTCDKLLKAIVEIIQDTIPTYKAADSFGLDLRLMLPQSIAISNGALAMIGLEDSVEDALRVRVFDTQSLSISLALAQLFAHLQSQLRPDAGTTELDDLLRNFDVQNSMVQSIVSIYGNTNAK